MPERRHESRPGSPDRRSFPRPPLWLNLLLLVLAATFAVGATLHRAQLNRQFDHIVTRGASAPAEINQLKAELAEMDLTEKELQAELESRLSYIEKLDSDDFYISIDTSKQRFYFNFGGDVVRDAPVQIGPPQTVDGADGKRWTFVPLKGEFQVGEKITGLEWRVPEWLYAMNGSPVPADRPVVKDGIGRYVLTLPNGYLIHSEPSADSPLKGPKPASFMVPADDLAAIWPRLNKNTKVFIF
jgi:hypothetical protein